MAATLQLIGRTVCQGIRLKPRPVFSLSGQQFLQQSSSFYGLNKSTLGATSISEGTDSLIVKWGVSPGTDSKWWSRFHYVWLRDNCQCAKCYHPETHQRLLNTLDIALDGKPKQATLSNQSNTGCPTLKIQWEDEHESSYSVDWLLRNSYEHKLDEGRTLPVRQLGDITADPVVWGSEISTNPPKVKYEAVMKDDHAFLEFSDKLERYGFCFVEDAPVDMKASEVFLKRVGIIRNTIYGGFWSFEPNLEADLDKGDTAYTSLAIDLHTDGNYFYEAPGVEMLHIVYFDGTGGESYLVDGHKLAQVIREENPEHYQILSSVPLPYHYTDKDHKLFNSFVPFTIDARTGKIAQVHFNNYDRLPIGPASMEALRRVKQNGTVVDIYAAIQTFLKTMENRDYQYWFRLEPGNMLLFDNHHILHARTAFTGRRKGCGGYINREDWKSSVMMAREGLS